MIDSKYNYARHVGLTFRGVVLFMRFEWIDSQIDIDAL